MRKRFAVIGLVFLFVAPMLLSTSCVRRSRMSGEFDGDWTSPQIQGQDEDEVTIEGDGTGALVIESDIEVWDGELEAEITGAHTFEIDDSIDGVDYEGEGEVRRKELELDIEVTGSNGQIDVSFEGDKS